MIDYKRGTTPTIPVTISAITDITLINTIEFIFKQRPSENAEKIILKTYPTNVTYDTANKIFYVYFTDAETRLFLPDKNFYMDTKITYVGGKIPKTKIVELYMNKTLFQSTD